MWFTDNLLTAVISEALEKLGETSNVACQLLLGTAKTEDLRAGKQKCVEGQLGVFQISPTIHQAVWDQCLAFLPEQASTIRGMASQRSFLEAPHQELVVNIRYASAIAWSIYCFEGLVLPEQATKLNLAQLWQKYYENGSKKPRLLKHFFQATSILHAEAA
ncbi:hypothetical protein H0A36_21290 [Endozoicomonas sp. SM1973]|uniref:Uncharacterized protein n=1 Tax=Spartinivicinus marinus TaxID=2994442 RepID=A0A853I5D7_9GAMM|nr:hypothetical protein [Spartinivicinus marinus]MCX4027749.1 hypothetical protein [Spartinivicinus marinus]NYZ68553.1 hypothetical protein [Spartinivicinus marinus]